MVSVRQANACPLAALPTFCRQLTGRGACFLATAWALWDCADGRGRNQTCGLSTSLRWADSPPIHNIAIAARTTLQSPSSPQAGLLDDWSSINISNYFTIALSTLRGETNCWIQILPFCWSTRGFVAVSALSAFPGSNINFRPLSFATHSGTHPS